MSAQDWLSFGLLAFAAACVVHAVLLLAGVVSA
jgi:hypothetical protein